MASLNRHTRGSPAAEELEGSPGDRHLDEWLIPRPGSALDAIAAEVFAATCGATSRKPRGDAAVRRRSIIAALVANLAVVTQGPVADQRLAVPSRNDVRTRYDRFPREALGAMSRRLEEAQLVTRTAGRRGLGRTTIAPTETLARPLRAADGAELTRALGAETIILRARAGRMRKVLIDYVDTPETRRLRAEMEDLNAFLGAADITHRGTPLAPFHLSRRFLITAPEARHTFNLHGRLYGAPWIGMERAERAHLAIDGEPLADLDFTGMMTNLAYLHAGHSLPEGDPYSDVPGLTDGSEPADRRAEHRGAVKRCLSALLCRVGPMSKLPQRIKTILPNWRSARLVGAIAHRHPDIAHLFGSDIGVSLMFTESQILMEVLGSLAAREIVALPIHDGIMVAVSRAAETAEAMVAAAEKVVGVRLPVKLSLPIAPC